MASDEITGKQDNILAELAAFRSFVEAKLASLEASFDSRLSSLESRFDSLEERVAKKLLETKPIWVSELNTRIDGLSGRIDELSDKIDVLSSDILTVRGSQRAVKERLNKIERGQHESRLMTD